MYLSTLHLLTLLVGFSAANMLDDSHERGKRWTWGRSGNSSDYSQCTWVSSIPSGVATELNIDTSYYTQYTHAYGIPIIGSGTVAANTLKRACYVAKVLLGDVRELREKLYKIHARVAIIPYNPTVSLPEFGGINSGGTKSYEPISTGWELNVGCLGGEGYDGYYEDILVHEVVHLMNMGVDSAFISTQFAAYAALPGNGLWAGTYGATSEWEYLAYGGQFFFDVYNPSTWPTALHNQPSTHTMGKLKAYDPVLYTLTRTLFPCWNTIIDRCNTSRTQEDNHVLTTDCFYRDACTAAPGVCEDCGYKIYRDKNSSGGTGYSYLHTPEECVNECNNDVNCEAFDFDLAQGYCYLHTSASFYAQQYTSYGVDQYVKYKCLECDYRLWTGKHSIGGIANYSLTTRALCVDACNNDAYCKAFDFDVGQGYCYLHTSWNFTPQQYTNYSVEQYVKGQCV